MAPYGGFSTLQQAKNEKDPIKLRKPIVEKMRRDRINGCIDQLKVLLEKELHCEACPKLEKADVLEMTVSFLKQQLGQAHRAPQVEAHKAPYRELKRTPHKEGQRAPHTQVRRGPHKEVRRVPHIGVQRASNKEAQRASQKKDQRVSKEVRRVPNTEVQRVPHKEQIQRAPCMEVHRLPHTWMQGSTTSLQPGDIATNSTPMWRPW
uniref:BHLH domain-containing protein n=1 Tax=Neogobius melanostomus TaxID=47308 RepID=A0A8C6WI46_9GOBI